MNAIELGKFLANLRNEKGLTQEELADKLYIDKRKVSRWECGTTIPEFEILIQLSEILDVSLYELSICKRLDKENISTKALNKFKSIKDFNNYKLKKKINIIITIILLIIFAITLTYTIRNQGSVQIYDIESLDEDYYIKGNYIRYDNTELLTITSIGKNTKKINYNAFNCSIEMNDEKYKYFEIINGNSTKLSNNKKIDVNKNHLLRIKCNITEAKEQINTDIINFRFIEKYNNSLFSFQ